MVLPACEALMVTRPAPLMVTVLPLSDTGPETSVKVTGRLDVAVALSVNGPSPYVLSAWLKVMVWFCCSTTVTLKLQLDWLPRPSCALHETLVTPTGYWPLPGRLVHPK